MGTIPQGMLPQTFEYCLAFTIAHEVDTPFMYNNWPIKNPKRDVTVGVGHALNSTDKEVGANLAAGSEIRNMFRVKGTQQVPSPEQMKEEFRRVYDLPRTGDNLFTDYQGKSPLEMDRSAMLRDLREKMLGYWENKGKDFPSFGAIPAQAQVALMSWNYGLRLKGAPLMCKAVNAGDFVEAEKQCVISGWDGQKNQAHKRLLANAAAIISNALDLNALPPMKGPFKPPPLMVAGATGPEPLSTPVGRWRVEVDRWRWIYEFDGQGGVRWTDPGNGRKGAGKWKIANGRLSTSWLPSLTTEQWDLPLSAMSQTGTCVMPGTGTFKLKAVQT